MEQKQRLEIVKKIINNIQETGVQNNQKDLIEVISDLLYSIGSSLENVDLQSSVDILMRYAQEPTLGNALMAQAIHMKETWSEIGKDLTNGKSDII